MARSCGTRPSSGVRTRLGLTLGAALLAALLSLACGGDGTDSAGSSSAGGTEIFGTQGLPLPSEVSAVASTGAPSNAQSILMSLMQPQVDRTMAASDLPADSDYQSVRVRKFVEVRALEVFDILSSIFDAVRQTHYEDHVGDGWYKNMVAFEDAGGDGTNQTRLEEWYVDSRMFETDSGNENRVQLKILSADGPGGQPELIRVAVTIREAPTLNADGSVADMGEWEIRALFGGSNNDYFHATAAVQPSGQSLVTLAESFTMEMGPGNGSMTETTRAIILRSATSGHGVVEFNDWQSCQDPSCGGSGPPLVEVSFAYNENYLTLQRGTDAPVSFDRHDDHELVHRYALFDSTDGSNVEKSKNFGFPVRTADNRHGWYGAWQDRHELWLDGSSAASGITVTREDLPPEQTPPSYTTERFDGALSRVDLVQGSIDQLDGVTAEIHIWNDFRLRWNATQGRWDLCQGLDQFGNCQTRSDFTGKLSSLQMPGQNDRRWVSINGCNETSPGQWACVDYVYDTDGFYVGQWGQNGLENTGTPLDTGSLVDDFELWASVGGQTYIEYTGEFSGPTTTTGWVEKTMTAFDEQTWTPTFDPGGDREFIFDLGREYFVNQRGSNLRVTRTAENGNAGDYGVFMEIHRVAKPVADLSPVIANGALLVDGWDPEGSSKYALNTNPASANYLLLEYSVVSDHDAGDNKNVGDVVSQDMWGLRIDGDTSPLESAVLYNWEYQDQNEDWGGVTYLKDAQQAYVLLDEPLHFDPIALARTDDILQQLPQNQWLTFSLTFDGWLQGIPDPWFELQRIGFEGAGIGAVLANNVRIPDGTLLTSSSDASTYYVKAVDVGIFLGSVNAFPNGPQPNLSLADALDLDSGMPTFVPHTMDSTIPSSAPLLYVEGLPIANQ